MKNQVHQYSSNASLCLAAYFSSAVFWGRCFRKS